MEARTALRGSGLFASWVILLAVAALLTACSESPEGARVSGKVVWRDMGLEDVPVRVLRPAEGNWREVRRVESGYHGTFSVRLPPGRHRLEARAERGGVGLHGALDVVVPPMGRVDRLTLELAAEAGR